MLELALGRDAAVRGLVAVHERLDDEVSLAVQTDGLLAPPTALAFAIGPGRPLRGVEFVAVEFVLPDQLPGRPAALTVADHPGRAR